MAKHVKAPDVPRFERHADMLDWWARLDPDTQLAARMKIQKGDVWSFIYFLSFCWIEAIPDRELSSDIEATGVQTGWRPTSGWVQMRPWEGQIKSILKMWVHWIVVWLKVRQYAATWIAAFRTVYTVGFFTNQKGGLISLEKETRGKALMQRVMACWNMLPPGLSPADQGDKHNLPWNDYEKHWVHPPDRDSGPQPTSWVRIIATTDFGTMSFTLTFAVVDEIAASEARGAVDVKRLVTSGVLESCRHLKAWVMLVSTGYMKGGWFFNTVQRLRQEEISPPKIWDDMGLIFNSVFDHPAYQDGNYDIIAARHQGDALWFAEHPRDIDEAFMTGGFSIFNMDMVEVKRQRILSGVTPRPKQVTFAGQWNREHVRATADENGECRLYVPPKRGHRYLGYLDPSWGLAKGDFCTMVMLDISSGETVCVLHARIPDAWDMARPALAMHRWYNDALIIPEINIRDSVLTCLQQMGCTTLYTTSKPGIGPMDEPLTTYGWRMNSGEGAGSKDICIAAAVEQMKQPPETAWLKVYDLPLLDECPNFVQTVNETTGKVKTGIPPGMTGLHDDLLVSTGVGCHVALQEPEQWAKLQARDPSDPNSDWRLVDELEPGERDEWEEDDDISMASQSRGRNKRPKRDDFEEELGKWMH